MTSVSIRPSDARREALKEADAELGSGRGVPLVSNFFPIERYYDAADKVLVSFEQAFDDRRLDDAYVYGKRFAAFSLDALPKHNYYRLPKYAKWRKKNGQEMAQVIQKLELIAKWMDEEEVEKERQRKRQILVHQAKIRKQKEEERTKMKELQAKIEQRRLQQKKGQSNKVASSAYSKLEQLNTLYPTDEKRPHENGHEDRPFLSEKERHSSSSLPSASRRDSSHEQSARSLNLFDETHTSNSSLNYGPSSSSSIGWESFAQDTLPPPIPPPEVGYHAPNANDFFPPPPSYNQIAKPPSYNQVASQSTSQLFPPLENSQNHNSWPIAARAGGAVVLPTEPPLHHEKVVKKPRPPKRIPIKKLRDQSSYEYKLLRQSKKIDVFGLDTYQGRYRSSTNGCTVISPLVVSQHLNSRHAISDSGIVDVIDNRCGPILRDIRSKLELEGDALIIPSDVHDYMVDRKILQQEKFVGASGGNILDEAHLGEFLKLLQKGEKGEHAGKKSGAALFFREHVVSIVKVPMGSANQKFAYDLVDSMPGMTDPYSNRLCATRTRCKDMSALKALLMWYACSKFSDSNCAYIDQNEWSESMADFDPRVFQAFVWADV